MCWVGLLQHFLMTYSIGSGPEYKSSRFRNVEVLLALEQNIYCMSDISAIKKHESITSCHLFYAFHCNFINFKKAA